MSKQEQSLDEYLADPIALRNNVAERFRKVNARLARLESGSEAAKLRRDVLMYGEHYRRLKEMIADLEARAIRLTGIIESREQRLP